MSAFRWLVIFDNVEDASDLEQLWPTAGKGKIIVTTRYPGIGYHLTDDEIPLPTLTTEQGRDCILSLASYPGGSQADPESAEELSKELGGLTIGIVQMVALMRARKSPMRMFVNDYKRNKLAYHGRGVFGLRGIYQGIKPTIGTNWTMSFDSLDEDSRTLLGIMSVIAPENIPSDLFNFWEKPPSEQANAILPFCSDRDE